MYKIILVLLLVLPCFLSFSQSVEPPYKATKKGSMYIYWGWNRSVYSNSDIQFSGKNYDFTLNNVAAEDHPTPFGLSPYFNLGLITIPQYNFRIGYFLRDDWEISIASDHMKYWMVQDQTVSIDGYIDVGNTTYDANYSGEDIVLKERFLKFEHTDGLNYLNAELRHHNRILEKNKVELSWLQGIGLGALVPKTNTLLLNQERYDEFHLAGYGLGAVLGLRLTFFQHFFIQSEAKGGFIHMPDIRTTSNKSDKAKQHFFFAQINWVFGASFPII